MKKILLIIGIFLPLITFASISTDKASYNLNEDVLTTTDNSRAQIYNVDTNSGICVYLSESPRTDSSAFAYCTDYPSTFLNASSTAGHYSAVNTQLATQCFSPLLSYTDCKASGGYIGESLFNYGLGGNGTSTATTTININTPEEVFNFLAYDIVYSIIGFVIVGIIFSLWQHL